MKTPEQFAETILRRHFDNVGGIYTDMAERDGVIERAAKAADGLASGKDQKRAVEDVVYGFIQNRAENPLDLEAISRARVRHLFPYNLGLPQPALGRLAEENLMTKEAVRAWVEEHGDLEQLNGIGPASAKILTKALKIHDAPEQEQEDENREGHEAPPDTPDTGCDTPDVLGPAPEQLDEDLHGAGGGDDTP